MKRILINKLLQEANPTAQLLEMLPAEGDKDKDAAREILAAGLKAAPAHGITTPEDFYFLVCSTTGDQLAPFLAGTPAAKLSKAQVTRAQAVLDTLLTNNAGRPAIEKGLSRKQQLAEAQRRRRANLKNQEGRKQLNDWISADAWEFLNTFKDARNLTRPEALDLILLAVKNGGPLPTL